MKHETKSLLLKKILFIEQELQSLKRILQEESGEELFHFAEDETIDAEVVFTEKDSAEQHLERLFSIMRQTRSSDEQKKALADLIHSSVSGHPPALESFFRFSFKTFQGRWADYLDENQAPSSFHIERRKENSLGELLELKLYLSSDKRSPSPITFKKDPKDQMTWKILSLSL